MNDEQQVRAEVECIEMIEHCNLPFNSGSAVVHIVRASCSAASEDSLRNLRLAAWYLDREMELKRRKRAGLPRVISSSLKSMPLP